MVGYNEITKFVKNIYYANGRKFDESYLPMWIREISNTGVDIQALHKAEQEIIRNNVPLKIFDICEIIIENKQAIALPLPQKTKCEYCNGKGYVIGLRFETNGKYTGYTAALNCCCDNPHLPNVTTMTPNAATNHKTVVKDGYYLVFPSVVEKFAYIDKVFANGGYDICK